MRTFVPWLDAAITTMASIGPSGSDFRGSGSGQPGDRREDEPYMRR